MMRGKEVTLWTVGAVAALLAVASFTGTGRGVGGSGVLTSMIWSYVTAVLLCIGVIWAIGSRAAPRGP